MKSQLADQQVNESAFFYKKVLDTDYSTVTKCFTFLTS